MNFFKRIFSRKSPEPGVEYNFSEFVLPPGKAGGSDEEVKGFYVEKNLCTACGAPEAEAPGLIEHSKSDGECYFKNQPITEEEVSQAINAVMVSCVDALRYGGNDEYILRRMYELGLEKQCDYVPTNSYRVVNRNVVTFYFAGTVVELAKVITESYAANPRHKVLDFVNDKRSRFSFIFRWAHLSHGSLFTCTHLENGHYKIRITDEEGPMLESVAGYAGELHEILKKQVQATNILWYEKEITFGSGSHIPW